MVTTTPPISTIAQQVAQVAKDLQRHRTGHASKAVTVVLSEDTLVITLYGALTPAEQALSKSREGAAQVQEFHRQLFQSSVDSLRQEIKRITGREVSRKLPPKSIRRREASSTHLQQEQWSRYFSSTRSLRPRVLRQLTAPHLYDNWRF